MNFSCPGSGCVMEHRGGFGFQISTGAGVQGKV